MVVLTNQFNETKSNPFWVITNSTSTLNYYKTLRSQLNLHETKIFKTIKKGTEMPLLHASFP